MMKKNIFPLQPDRMYHIYNRGINGGPLFFDHENYLYFLKLIKLKIRPVAQIYSYCLLKNHFHLLVKINSELTIRALFSEKDKTGIETIISQQFSNTFNSYSQAVNKRYARTGKLFELPFRRKDVDSSDHLVRTILYINKNPVKHGITEDCLAYPYSSAREIINNEDDFLESCDIMNLFSDVDGFKDAMKDRTELGNMSKSIEDGGIKTLETLLNSGDVNAFDTTASWVDNDGNVQTSGNYVQRWMGGNKILSSYKAGTKVEDFLKTNMGKSALINILAAKRNEPGVKRDQKAAIDYTINQITKTFTQKDGKTRVPGAVIARTQKEMKEIKSTAPLGAPGYLNEYDEIAESTTSIGIMVNPILSVPGPLVIPTINTTKKETGLDAAVRMANSTSNTLSKKYTQNVRMVHPVGIITGKDGNEVSAQAAFLQVKDLEGDFYEATGDGDKNPIPDNAELDTKNGKNIKVISEGLNANGVQMVSFEFPVVSTEDDKSVYHVAKTEKIEITKAPKMLVAGMRNKSKIDHNDPKRPEWTNKSFVGGLPNKEEANDLHIKTDFAVKFKTADKTEEAAILRFNTAGFSPIYHQQIREIVNDNYKILIKKNDETGNAYLEVRDGKNELVIDSTPFSSRTNTIEDLTNDPIRRYVKIQEAIEIKLNELMTKAYSNGR